MELYCHGSEKNQAKTTVLTDGTDTKQVRLRLMCRNKQFVDIKTEDCQLFYRYYVFPKQCFIIKIHVRKLSK